MVFNIKMVDVRCQAPLVAGGLMTIALIFPSVFSIETVHVLLMIDTFNDIEVETTDILKKV